MSTGTSGDRAWDQIVGIDPIALAGVCGGAVLPHIAKHPKILVDGVPKSEWPPRPFGEGLYETPPSLAEVEGVGPFMAKAGNMPNGYYTLSATGFGKKHFLFGPGGFEYKY